MHKHNETTIMHSKKILAASMVALMVMVAVIPLMGDSAYAEDPTVIPDGEEYVYILYTDTRYSTDVIDVQVSVGNHPTDYDRQPISKFRTGTPANPGEGIPMINSFWSFSDTTGIGPFNAFYAAVNLMPDNIYYDADDDREARYSTDVGAVAYILKPSDITQTLAGNAYTSSLYNIMLIVPTVYIHSSTYTPDTNRGNLVAGTTYNALYLSNIPQYKLMGTDYGTSAKPTVAYAHSASTTPGQTDFTNVYPYMAIGVYEASLTGTTDPVGEGKLVSQTGRNPVTDYTADQFKGFADALTPAVVDTDTRQSDYQMWNFYQWTLYKMMSYTVMGTKNSQLMVGQGYVASGTGAVAVTGSTDSLNYVGKAGSTTATNGTVTSGPTSTATKLYIESAWGSAFELIGDALVMGESLDRNILYAGNYLGGETLASHNQPSTYPASGEYWMNARTTPAQDRIESVSANQQTWDMPTGGTSTVNAWTITGTGDASWTPNAAGTYFQIKAGGNYSTNTSAGIAAAWPGSPVGTKGADIGTRLAYMMSNDAVKDERTYTVSIGTNDPAYGTVSTALIENVPSGASIVADGTTLTIGTNTVTAIPADPTDQFEYALASWNLAGSAIPSGTTVQGDMTITAMFERNVRTYDVPIVMNDPDYGTVSTALIENVPYGTPITVTGTTATLGTYGSSTATVADDTDQYSFSWSGWTYGGSPVASGTTQITSAAPLIATVDATIKVYTITWIIGTDTETQSYEYGAMPSHTDPDAPSGEVFKGWEPQVVAVTGPATYTATFGPAGNDAVHVILDAVPYLVIIGILFYAASMAIDGRMTGRDAVIVTVGTAVGILIMIRIVLPALAGI